MAKVNYSFNLLEGRHEFNFLFHKHDVHTKGQVGRGSGTFFTKEDPDHYKMLAAWMEWCVNEMVKEGGA